MTPEHPSDLSKIPVPPYDRDLPVSYWAELETPPPRDWSAFDALRSLAPRR